MFLTLKDGADESCQISFADVRMDLFHEKY